MRVARCWPELREVFASGFEQKFFVIPETNGGGVRAARGAATLSAVVPAKAGTHTA
jgi:hypothetical protein